MKLSRLPRAAACALGIAVAGQALAADLKIIVPASPGGGWDQLGRTVQQSLQAGKLAGTVQVSNVSALVTTLGLVKQ